MIRVVPWAGLVALGSPFAPVGKKGRPPFAVTTMLMLRSGTVVDATLIAAPSSTKNASGTRDPEMHQTMKDNQWHFGMKAHIGADAESGLVQTVRETAANVSDVVEANALLSGEEERIEASIRAKVGHPFRVIRRQFGFVKVRYRGLMKNTAQLTTLFALSNLRMARGKLLGAGA